MNVSNVATELPLFFGPPDRPLFGWLHRPAAAGGLGVVICNAFGYEAICTHRSMRHFARVMAASGTPALRFDYDGTGDSAGSDIDADRLQTWIGSIDHAVNLLRHEMRVDRVVLLGVRFGATLAALAAVRRDDIAGLIAIAPVISGKTYARELRTLAMLGARNAPPALAADATDVLEAAGAIITTATRAELNSVDLMRLARQPAPKILIVDRDDFPQKDTWAQYLGQLGAAVTALRPKGYSAMMCDPHENEVPVDILACVRDWLREQRTSGQVAATVQPAAVADDIFRATGAIRMSGKLAGTETAQFIDPERKLFGILSTPATQPGTEAKPAHVVLLLNAGAVHHIGPNRMYVECARYWIARGYAVMRLDISGIGDSSPRDGAPENDVYTPHAAEDIKVALRLLRSRFGDTRYHLMGLCSGAYHTFKAAVNDLEFDSAIVINPLTFFWKPWMPLSPIGVRATWAQFRSGHTTLRSTLKSVYFRAAPSATGPLREMARQLKIRLPHDLGNELQRAARNGIDMLTVFASGEPGLRVLHSQGGSVVSHLLRTQALRIDTIDAADHTFTANWARLRLRDLLTQYIEAPHSA